MLGEQLADSRANEEKLSDELTGGSGKSKENLLDELFEDSGENAEKLFDELFGNAVTGVSANGCQPGAYSLQFSVPATQLFRAS